MKNIELKIGVSVPAWTYHECEHCGIIYPISRCSVKTVTEKDLMCQERWDARVISDKEDEIADMKQEIQEYREKLKQIAGATVYNFNYETAKPIYDLLEKYSK